jgi:hypothetical protein
VEVNEAYVGCSMNFSFNSVRMDVDKVGNLF